VDHGVPVNVLFAFAVAALSYRLIENAVPADLGGAQAAGHLSHHSLHRGVTPGWLRCAPPARPLRSLRVLE